jgi:hypothetical protein
MNRRYAIACSLGFAVGLLSVVYAASLNPFGTSWEIPNWDRWQQYTRPEMLPLQFKALTLRSLRLVHEEGLWFFLIPVTIACGLAKLDELGDHNRYLRCVSKSVLITIASACFVSFMWGMHAGLTDTGHPAYLEYQLFAGFEDAVFLLCMACVSLIAPAFGVIVYFVLLDRSKLSG